MGYYVNIEESNIRIPADKVADAYELLCALNDDNSIKSGGKSSRYREEWLAANATGANTDAWFSWMPWNYPEVYATAAEILDALGFEFDNDEQGITIYAYDNKAGDEEHFLAALAPLLESTDDRPAQIVWRGEDGTVWRQIVIDGAMAIEYGRMVFTTD